ncbi:MAG TPA: hypothetical protein DCY53_14545 [Desulfobacteraceae bacterium]|nr:hypothetical protein [Desulfobacteraceae bacterium]
MCHFSYKLHKLYNYLTVLDLSKPLIAYHEYNLNPSLTNSIYHNNERDSPRKKGFALLINDINIFQASKPL